MKVTREKEKYAPVNIKLENMQEFNYFVNVLTEVYVNTFNEGLWVFVKELRNELEVI